MQTAATHKHCTVLFFALFFAGLALAPLKAQTQSLSPPQSIHKPMASTHDPMGLSASKSTVSGAKNLAGRFGVGVARLGPKEAPALSLDWQMSSASSLQFNLGMDHTKSTNNFLIDGLFSRNLFVEQSMHFFIYGGGGLLSEKSDSTSKSGLLVEGGVGGRFFVTGLPYLGLSFRGGVQLRTTNGTRFGTRAHFGAHYYF